eukprot:gene9759-7634_t
MSKLKIGDPGQRPEADVVLKKVTLGAGSKRPNVSTVTAIGHLDEVQDLKRGGSKLAGAWRLTWDGNGNTISWLRRPNVSTVIAIGHLDKAQDLKRGGSKLADPICVLKRPNVSTVIAIGHLDEAQDLKRGGSKLAEVLGEGAFSRVVRVTEETTGRQFAMKRMTKASAMQSPEHVFYEQHITCNIAHPFCLRQYASFQDPLHLYFLFDLMPGEDLMDVLVAEAKGDPLHLYFLFDLMPGGDLMNVLVAEA